MEHVLSLSYGKDSLACLGAIEQLGWPLDRIVHVENDLLSLIYTTATRGGCWFCHNQSINQLRLLRKNYPDYWALMLKWDSDSPVTFKSDGHTLHDYDKRFALEEMELVPQTRKFRWTMLSDYEHSEGQDGTCL